MKFPITVSKIEAAGRFGMKSDCPLSGAVGTWVSIRPCDPAIPQKTYLGVLLGELPLGVGGSYDKETGVLKFEPSAFNPAIWVPDIKQVIMGCASWWGEIESPEDLKQITDADINSVWYVRALKELSEKEAANGSTPASAGA